MIRGSIYTFTKPVCYFDNAEAKHIRDVGKELHDRLFDIADAVEKMQDEKGWFFEMDMAGDVSFWCDEIKTEEELKKVLKLKNISPDLFYVWDDEID